MLVDCCLADYLFELQDYLPRLGCAELKYRVGMTMAIVTLNASLRPGQYGNHLQYDSTRKTPTWFRHTHNAGEHYHVETLYVQDKKKVHVTTCVVVGKWFVRFKLRMKL